MLPSLYCHVFGVDPYSMVKDGVLTLDQCKATWLEIESLYKSGAFISGHAALEHKPVGRRPSIEEPKASRYKENIQLSLDL